MIKLEEARAITREVQEERARERATKIINFCDNEVTQEIIKQGQLGLREATVECKESELRNDIMRHIVESEGFMVIAVGTKYINIRW